MRRQPSSKTAPKLVRFSRIMKKQEATPRIELGIEVLHTPALPLGYVA
jgi:hypothetical protein